MHRTRLGTLLLASGWACFPLALIARSLALAVAGTLLVALVLSARIPALTLSVERKMPERAEASAPFEIETHATTSGRAPLFITDKAPARAEVLSSRLEATQAGAKLTTRLSIPVAGVGSWSEIGVRAQDPRGLVEEQVHIPFVTHLPVRPTRDAIVLGSSVGRRHAFKSKKSTSITMDFEEEVEHLREYQPGDRLRDVDWAHSSKFSKLMARVVVQQPILPVVILLDAGISMRQAQGTPKLTTATQAALGVIAAARQRNVGVGFVAFSENGVEAQMRVTANRSAITTTMGHLAKLPTTTSARATPREIDSGQAQFKPTANERDFLRAANAFNRQTYASATPLESALLAVQRASPQPSLVIAIVDVETSPAMAPIIAKRLATHGHRTAIVGLRSGPHAYRLAQADDAAAAQLIEWRSNREHARVACQRARVPFVMLNPNVTIEQLREVVASIG